MNSNYETKVFHIHTEGDRFGFTLAGQFPCQLVKIQHGSPAEKAGLKSGDEIIEVGGVNVEDLKHDCVASFIAPSSDGITRITELRIRRTLSCPCERTVERTRDVQKYVSEERVLNLSKIVDRVVEEFKRPATPINTPSATMRRGCDLNNGSDLASDEELRASFVLDTTTLHTSAAANISTPSKASNLAQNTEHGARKPSKIEAVVGYLGSIERPATTRDTSDSLVARLSMKTKTPALVLLEVSSMGLFLSNSSKQLIMTCPISSLMYAGICPENKQVIGLFTKHLNVEGGKKVISDVDVAITSDCDLNCSCHLFMIEPSLIRHPNHKSLTDRFQLRCVPDPGTGSCQQFPTSSAAILNALSAYLKGSSTAQIASTERHRLNVSLSGRQVEDSKQSGLIFVEESCKNDLCPTTPCCLAEQGDTDSQHGQVLCLHLQPLGHGCMTKEREMDCKRQGDYSSGIRSINRPTTSQKSTSVGFISTTGTTSSHINHVQCMSTEERFKLDKSGPKDLLKPPGKGKENHGGHKTLVHRRSQSLASSVANTLQAVAAIQSLECYSQGDFRIGNGNRPVFHASSANMVACNNTLDGKVARWAVGFDRLLEDKTGMDIFRSFLQKEYSEENLIFWLACEKYRTIEDKNELKTSAADIYEAHLKACATLPVNVESKTIREVEELLECPTTELFKALQHQVYTLMKFDSYTRFLKSELYQQCLVNEMEGKPLPIEQVEESKKEEEGTSTLKRMVNFVRFGDSSVDIYFSDSGINDLAGIQFSSTKGKGRKTGGKSQTLQNNTETDESKKKSFLPWRGRLKSDQTKRTTNRSSDSQPSSTRSSLSSLSDSVFSSNITNSDEALNDSDGKDQPPPSCRVILPDRSLMYLFCKSTRSLREGLSKLCEKKEYSLPALDLFVANRKLTMGNLERKLTRFINKEIVLKQGVLFRVQLPNDRIVGVKADEEQTIDKILAPILQQFGFDIKDVTMHFRNNKQPLDTGSSVSSLHLHCVIVEDHSRSEVCNTDKNIAETRENHLRTTKSQSNTAIVVHSVPSNEYAVFGAIMNGKRQSMSGFCFDENGVFVPVVKQVESKDTLSTSTKEKERLTRSPALFRKKKRDGPQTVSSFQTFIVEDDKKETEELFSLLRRSQNSRIDDQRGLLNKKVELPDFLKLPEKTNRRNNFLHVGVPSPRARHHSLKKSNSSPPTYTAWASQQARSQPPTIAEQPKPREANVTRNWSGSLLHRSRTQVETTTTTQVVTQVIETQTVDRKRFLKPSQDSTTVNRLRAGSLPQDHPDDRSRELLGGNELKGRSRYHYGSEASFGSSSEKQVVWVSNAMNRNRRRGSNRTNRSTDANNENQTDDESHSRLVEVIIPETKTDASRFAITGGVVPYCDRPKPITDSTFFREYLESSNLHMPTHDDQSKARDFESANDREAILDNSFLRDELKQSRLFSQLSPEVSTPLESLSPVERRRQRNEGSAKCPLFIPPNITLTPGDEVLAGRNNLRTYENHAGSTNTSCDSYDDQDLESTRHAYWSQSDMATDEEAVRVTFV